MYFPDLPPAARSVEPEEPDALVPGACPRCGSADVVHVMVGLPAADDAGRRPDGVRRAGCVHPGHDRECRSCGAAWVQGAATSPR